jgi:putative transposase
MTYVNYDNVYFFTATILRWQRLLDNDDFKLIIVNSFRHFSVERCEFYGFVIMPNHIHVIMRLRNDFEIHCSKFPEYYEQRFYL